MNTCQATSEMFSVELINCLTETLPGEFRMKNLGKVILIGICTFSITHTGSSAAFGAGSLDPAFGTNGVTVTDFGIGDDEAYDLVVQGDGKIVVAGFSYNGAVRNMAVARYLPGGKLDSSFSDDGYATFSLGTGDTVGRSLAIQSDGKIIVAGSTEGTDLDMAVIRLMADGNLDADFGSNGHLVVSLADGNEYASAVKVATDGTIYLAGAQSKEDSPVATIVARVDSGGDIETAFGTDGLVTVDRTYSNSGYSLNINENGTVLVAGSNSSNGGYAGSLLQFSSDGSLDSDFGTDGEFSLTIEESDVEIFDAIVLEDGRIVVAGYLHNGSYREPLLAGLLANGMLDDEFGQDGIVHTDLGYDGVAYAVAPRPDGSLLLTGYGITSSGKDMILLEVDDSGTELTDVSQNEVDEETAVTTLSAVAVNQEEAEQADTSETITARYLVTDIAAYDDVSRAISILPEGAVVTAGYASNGTDTDIAVVRYTAEQLPENFRSAAGGAGEITGKFFVTTFPVFDIARNSAASGGSISERVSEQNCETLCGLECISDTDDTCYDTCYDDCLPEDVIARGVVYSVVPFPVYRTDDDTDDEADTETTTTNIFPTSSADTAYNYTLVRSGQTSDGTGVGEFGSDIYDITPDVLYYVRAYAVIDDNDEDDGSDTVIYGNQVSFRTSDSCFIATAAFGSILDSHVVVLRQFRDQILKKYLLGRKFIKVYYEYSPALADVIQRHDMLRSVTRIGLMPLIGMSYIILHGSLFAQVAVLIFALSATVLMAMSLIRIRNGNKL
jgi:uncharacterized delta-60 repeat protein